MHVSYINVFVDDLAGAIEFYRDCLGLELQFASHQHGYASFSAGSVRLALATARDEHASLVGRHTGVGFEVADIQAEHGRLAGRGVHFVMPPTNQPWGGLMAMFEDPSGNVYYLNEPAR
ncbi:VOC family protein [Pseudomarimonas salicorniae]|uniref:VOC family protein n=1 Tax=Pseudomarimonas salicorniae TaxID=2933270 RepID=UPI003CCDDAEE